MTPEEAEDIYYAAYRDSMHRQQISDRNPVNQAIVRKDAWQAVIDAVTKEIDTDWARRFLALQQYDSVAKKLQ